MSKKTILRSKSCKDELESYFKGSDILTHLYEIGDLDDFFWPKTSWYAYEQDGADVRFIALRYSGADPPVIIALGTDIECGRELLLEMHTQGIISKQFYSHLSIGLSSCLVDVYNAEHHGRYLKMGLMNFSPVQAVDTSGTERLTLADLRQIEAFYRIHYPGNWFDARMLETTQTFGIWSGSVSEEGRAGQRELLAIAGIHVFSTTYSVAALGNIAVHLEHRGRGLARQVTAALVQSLLYAGIQHIGLNVLAENGPAVACYKKLGFEQLAEFEEIMWTSK